MLESGSWGHSVLQTPALVTGSLGLNETFSSPYLGQFSQPTHIGLDKSGYRVNSFLISR